jgi:hypothetical protein
MARASSSLPVPLSPRISTLASEAATSRASASSSAMAWLRLMISARHSSSFEVCDALGAVMLSASSIRSSSTLASKGLVR